MATAIIDYRKVVEDKRVHGVEAKVAYAITIPASWGLEDPTSFVAKVYDVTGGGFKDVTTASTQGSGSAVGRLLTTPLVKSLAHNKDYRIYWIFNMDGNTLSAWYEVRGKR
ncbi:MAG: hypothetical protein XU15_C0011G0127 [candidate division NC10 bacterium CSP1-5]|nr:MAG: hypothetical protein XU15_C0011G0127 [candidate division NC10 bacterium CSP1-5]